MAAAGGAVADPRAHLVGRINGLLGWTRSRGCEELASAVDALTEQGLPAAPGAARADDAAPPREKDPPPAARLLSLDDNVAPRPRPPEAAALSIHKFRVMVADWARFVASRPAAARRRLRRGVPDRLRGLVWPLASGGRSLLLAHPGRYAQLLASDSAPPPAAEDEILRDVRRTRPTHAFYATAFGPGQRGLFSVLRAYAAWDPEVGYAQGLAFAAALLLLTMPPEDAFFTLAAVLAGGERTVPSRGPGAPPRPAARGLYTPGLPLLSVCLTELESLIQSVTPALAAHLATAGVGAALWATEAYLTLGAKPFPADHASRLWDCLVVDGLDAITRCLVACVCLRESTMLALPPTVASLLPAMRAVAAGGGGGDGPSPDEIGLKCLELKLDARLAAVRAANTAVGGAGGT